MPCPYKYGLGLDMDGVAMVWASRAISRSIPVGESKKPQK